MSVSAPNKPTAHFCWGKMPATSLHVSAAPLLGKSKRIRGLSTPSPPPLCFQGQLREEGSVSPQPQCWPSLSVISVVLCMVSRPGSRSLPHLPPPHRQPLLPRPLSGPQPFLSFTFDRDTFLQSNKESKAWPSYSFGALPQEGMQAKNPHPEYFSAALWRRQGPGRGGRGRKRLQSILEWRVTFQASFNCLEHR